MKFTGHKYTYENSWSPRHCWQLIGPRGGIHFHASINKEYGDFCGLEFHDARPQEGKAPSQSPCWLLGCPCWHDGTSLYASEQIWPIVKNYLSRGDHEATFRLLEREYEKHFERDIREQAA